MIRRFERSDGRILHLGGRQRRVHGVARVHFSDFVSHAALPAVPSSYSYFAKGGSAMTDILGNDAEGNCIYAAGYHFVALATGASSGTPFHASLAQVNHDYSAVTSFRPGDPSTDNGGQIEDGLRYWKKTGFANGTKLLGAVAVNASSPVDLRAAAYLFGGLFFGAELADQYLNVTGNGFVWGAQAPNPNNGHAFLGTGYGVGGIEIDTWGLRGTFTYDAIAELCSTKEGGEVYALLTPDLLAKGKLIAANGFAWDELVKAFDADFGGNVPVPVTPAPAPAPPLPPLTVSLANVQKWAADGIAANWPK